MYQPATPQELNRYNSLLAKTVPVEAFTFEGVLFRGNRKIAVEQFIKNNPQPADMYVWLCDNYQMIK